MSTYWVHTESAIRYRAEYDMETQVLIGYIAKVQVGHGAK